MIDPTPIQPLMTNERMDWMWDMDLLGRCEDILGDQQSQNHLLGSVLSPHLGDPNTPLPDSMKPPPEPDPPPTPQTTPLLTPHPVTAPGPTTGNQGWNDAKAIADKNVTGMSSGVPPALRVGRIRTLSRGVISGTKRVVSSVEARHSLEPYSGRIEINNHPDTTCARMNCVPMYYTGQVCNVMRFSDAQKDVPIGGVVTA